ncbi:MAG: hypothetical protein ACJAU1_001144 [Psychromonas sp.]
MHELEKQRCVAPITKGITITSCCVLLWSPSLRLTKHLEVTWVYAVITFAIDYVDIGSVSVVLLSAVLAILITLIAVVKID